MIDFQGVSCRLGDREFFYDLQIPLGQIVAVMGASGSGKSTLLNLFAGFIKADHGAAQIMFDQQRVDTLEPSKRPVTSLFQEYNLFAHMSVFNNVALGIAPSLKLTKQQIEDVNQSLEQVGLGGFGQRLPSELSGGQRQRVALGRALVRRKPVLLLDEPFSALDPALRQEMSLLVKHLARLHKLTVLLVTHEPKDALALSDEVVFIHQGKVHWQGASPFFLEQDDPAIKTYLGHK